MAVAKLTKRAIDSTAHDGPGWKVLYDHGGVPGFGVRIRSHSKTFFCRYRTRGGRQRYHSLGRYGILTVEQARERAREVLAAVAAGEDPAGVRRAERGADTVEKLCNTWLELYGKPHRRTWGEDKRRIEKRIVPAIGHLTPRDVQPADLTSLHIQIGSTEGKPTESNRVLQLYRTIHNWGLEQGILPAGTPNPAEGFKKFREQSRDRFISREEMPKLAEAIGKYPNIYVQGAIWLLLLTGLRKSELLPRRWDEVDMKRRRLLIPDSKGGEPIDASLSEPAMKVLDLLPREKGNPHIFPSRARSHLKDIRQLAEIVKKAKLKNIRPHDLRRTLGSWMAEEGASLLMISRALHHRDLSSVKVYARLQDGAEVEAINDHGERVRELAGEIVIVKPE